MQQQTLEQAVSSILKEFGVKVANKGYRYTREAIIIAVNDNTAVNKIVKGIYTIVAKDNADTPSRVERSIGHSIETACNIYGSDICNKVFGNSIDPNKFKPTNSEFIASVADYIVVNKLYKEAV